jgi:acyl-CoA thioesterase FadM
MQFQRTFQVAFHDADPAGLLFFARIYTEAHRTLEAFVVESLGLEWRDWFQRQDVAFPIRHSKCEHLAPLWAGTKYTISLAVRSVSDSSWVAGFRVEPSASSSPARALVELELVISTLDLKSKSKGRIPDFIRERLITKIDQSS